MIKFKKKYYINDGLDGIVIAKNLKHAIKILCKNGYKGMFNEIMKGIRKSEKDPYSDSDWVADGGCKVISKRSHMVGWTDY